jgi:hypothetical protein
MQSQNSPARMGPRGMVFPVSGAPITLEQVEERTRTLADGTTDTEILRQKIYRDSVGRMRIEETVNDPSDKSLVLVCLIDPSPLSIVVLTPDKTAARLLPPKDVDRAGLALPSLLQELPHGNWEWKTENLGRRKIEGIDFEGSRLTRTSSEYPGAVALDESWNSKELRLTGLAFGSGPNGSYTVNIQNVDRSEPDPRLFTIPSDYTIQDLSSGK